MSGAVLYLAIVAIWAFVLIPRWLRRPHLLGGENDKYEESAHDSEGTGAEPENADIEPDMHPDQVGHGVTVPRSSRPKVLQARRRLLTTLLTLMIVAAACTYLKLTSWWVCAPPAVMLGMYLVLLREAALADAEQARRRAADGQRVQAARRRADADRPDADRPEHGAQIIDISARLGDQLYDQYADATIRAVGD